MQICACCLGIFTDALGARRQADTLHARCSRTGETGALAERMAGGMQDMTDTVDGS